MNEQTRREVLRSKREQLFKRFWRNPSEITLAIEIKSIDDQIAESVVLSQRDKSAKRS
jgi:hypothetical protein